MKAVAPSGTEHVVLTITQDVPWVSILGEKLEVVRPDAPEPDNFVGLGRPIAIISNVQISYRPR